MDKIGAYPVFIGALRRGTECGLTKPTGEWAWARMLDASGEFRPGDRPTCFAYMKDRIAVAYPQMGVKVWLWVNGESRSPGALDPELNPPVGMWQQQRSILRHHVTNIRFVEGGKALIGGTSDCVLWVYCPFLETGKSLNAYPGGIARSPVARCARAICSLPGCKHIGTPLTSWKLT